MRLTATVTREEGWYVAQCLEVDVASQGETIEEALENLKEAVELLLEDASVPIRPTPMVAPLHVAMAS